MCPVGIQMFSPTMTAPVSVFKHQSPSLKRGVWLPVDARRGSSMWESHFSNRAFCFDLIERNRGGGLAPFGPCVTSVLREA